MTMNYEYVIYNIFVHCNWVDTRWQWYGTYLHTNTTQNNTMKQNTQNGTYITKKTYFYKNKQKHKNMQPYIK